MSDRASVGATGRGRMAVRAVAALAVLGLVAVGCGSSSKSSTATGGSSGSSTTAKLSGDPIPIGVAVAQSGGSAALLGQDQVTGTKIAETYFNERGGVGGRPIKVVLQDTLTDEAGTINAFNTLINQQKVVGIIGPTLSQQAFAADPVADKAKVPVVGPSNTAKGVPEIGEFVSRVSAPVAKVAPNAIKAALKINPNIKKAVVLFAQNDAFSKSETGTFQDAVKANNIELAQPILTFQTTDTDFTNQVNATIGQKPDLVVISGLATDGGNLVRQLRETGYKGVIVGGNGFNTSQIYSVCKAQCDGIIVAQAYSYDFKSPANDAFRKVYMDQKKEEPLQIAAQAFTAVQVYVEALRAVDQTTKLSTLSLPDLRVKLNSQILAGKYQTVLGDISFEPSGEIVQSTFYVAQIKMDSNGARGKFVYLNP